MTCLFSLINLSFFIYILEGKEKKRKEKKEKEKKEKEKKKKKIENEIKRKKM